MRMEETIYDVCIIGAGMVGSAAAKWLCKLQPETKVCLIGPQEPTEEEWQSGKREIFSSHYDEGRLTRELNESLIWSLLARRSIQRYRQIEKESGINFYQEVGCLYADLKNGESLHQTVQNAETIGNVAYKSLNAAGLKAQFPYLHAEESWQMLFNFKNAGHVSARNLVAAQQKIAASHGCDIINDVVVKVQEKEKSRDSFINIVCQSGRKVAAKRVLLCTGAFSNSYDLLPRGKQIEFYPIEVSVMKAELSQDDALKMADMPVMMSRVPGKQYYILPPIKYPDGKYYIKIGDYNTSITLLRTHQEIAEWFRSQGRYEDDTDEAVELLKFIVQDLNPISVTTSCCVSSHTPTKLLYCDMITPRLGALMGMSGQGAKSSDEIGRMGAKMIARGAWDYDLPAELFRLQYKKMENAKL
ncbi:uncharacterized protein LOC577652 [Strongylocentrotus purpuratus]|uniref:FAD dependent oxidoreductase domain-containing protein n=1 Tax=Strongylocentrotus purpuratus TaxID=7668 RepID=A0A7M7RDW7_STRPU|nr:uncharacterized protein LOC577652 [Strongylocentrotus purpuratus]